MATGQLDTGWEATGHTLITENHIDSIGTVRQKLGRITMRDGLEDTGRAMATTDTGYLATGSGRAIIEQLQMYQDCSK